MNDFLIILNYYFELHQRNSDKFWKFCLLLLLAIVAIETGIEIAGTVMYTNVISTCVTRGLTCVLRNDTQPYAQLVIFS